MTKPPRIVKEHRKAIGVLPPPPPSRILYPNNLTDTTFDIYLRKGCMDEIMEHCRAYAGRKLEVMGLLVGDVFSWKTRRFTLVRDVVSTDLDATNISVRFDSEGFEGLFGQLEDLLYDYVIVGWYHSHPGLGCFLSATDIQTQKRMFYAPFHTALVVDPIQGEIKAYMIKGDGYTRRLFAVYRGKGDSPGLPSGGTALFQAK